MIRNREGELPLGCGIALLAAIFGPMFLLSAGGIVWGWSQIRHQHRLLTTAQETDAKIITSKVEWRAGSRNQEPEYEPVVRFSYSVDGKRQESSVVTPARDAGEHAWAREMVRKFPVGKQTTAYFDTTDPSRAFLVREYLPYPYLLTGFASMFAGFAIVFPASFFWPWPTVRASMALAGTLVYELPILAAVKHYFDYASPKHEQAVLWAAVAIAVGVVPFFLALRWWFVDPKRVARKLYTDE